MTEMPYQGVCTFLKGHSRPNMASIHVVGIPYDLGTTYRPGTRFGPRAIRQASMMLTDGVHPEYPVELRGEIADLGDIGIDRIPELPFTKTTFIMGGDHSITYPVLRQIGDPEIALIHFDAHQDTSLGDGHGTWLRKAIEHGLVKASNVVSIGIRAPIQPSTRGWFESVGGTVITARRAVCPSVFYEMLWAVQGAIANRRFYVTFDIDCLDPAFAPGTGTPEAGGLDMHTVLNLIHSLNEISSDQFVGMDMVEVNEAYDQSEVTSLAAATIMWTIASKALSR